MKGFQANLVSLVLMSIITLYSCESHKGPLFEAEQLLETNPAAADSILTSMPAPQTNRNRAWYAVLKTQADYKQYKPISSDSLILIATRYYGNRHKNYRSAMAWYTQGCVYTEQKDDVEATESFLHALDLFPDTLNKYYVLAEKSIGDIYLRKTLYEQALSMYSNCRNNAVAINDSVIISYCDYKIATVYLYKENYDVAEKQFSRLKDDQNLSSFYRNESKLNYCKIQLYNKEDYETTTILLSKYIKENEKLQGLANSMMGVAHYKMCNFDSAFYYLNMSLETEQNLYTKSVDYSYLLELACLKSDSKSAHMYSRLYTQLMDSVLLLENANEVVATKIMHIQDKYRKDRREFLFRVLSLSATTFLLLFLIIAFILQRKVNKFQEYYINLIDEYRQKQIKLKEKSSESEIIDYCIHLFEMTPSSYIIKNEDVSITGEIRRTIMHDLAVSFSEYYSFAQNNYPGLNTLYINYCFLNYLKVSHSRVIDILCISENNYRVCKSRIRKILDSSNRLYPQ